MQTMTPLEAVATFAVAATWRDFAELRDPEDDVLPAAFLAIHEPEEGVLEVPLAPQFMTDADTKALLSFVVLPEMIRAARASAVAVRLMAYAVRRDFEGDFGPDRPLPPEVEELAGRIKEQADRVELVVIEAFAHGDQETHLNAQVSRRPDGPPRLGDFERLPANTESYGLFTTLGVHLVEPPA